MSAYYAVAETGCVDIPDTWTEIPDGVFKNCDWLTGVTIPNRVTNIAPTAFVGCSNIVSVTVGCQKVAGVGLLHRWCFNGDLKDLVGGSDATIVGNVTTDGRRYMTPGGSSGSAYIDLGDNLVPRECEAVTLEFWATQDARGSYDRIFDFGSMPAGYDFTRYDTSCYSPDNIRMDWKGNITSFGATGWSLSVGTEYHIAVVYEKGQGSRWVATYYIQDATGSGELFKVSCEADSGWSFASVGQTEWLLGQPLTCWDSCAKASYNEVRIWNRALTEEDFKTATEDGPDAIKMGTGRIRSIFPDSSIHSVRVNDDVADLPDGFFSDCTTLESVTLPDALMTVGKEAFKGCSSLAAIAIPSGVTNIGENAFLGCENLKRVDVATLEDWLKIKFANAAANPLCYGAELYVSGEKIVDLVVPEGVSEIGDGAFKGCMDLRSVEIPSSVTNIATTAFEGCDNITNIALYGGVSSSQQIVPELIEGTKWTEEPETLDGDKVYKSNVINHSQSTAIEFEIPEGMERLVFSWKVGSENNYDWLTWFLDGVQKDRISGTREWATLTNELDGAVHRLKFVYSKDGSASTSPDCGWVSVRASDGRPLMLKDLFPDSPLVTVVIGDEAETLPDGFFADCTMMESVSLPDAIPTIGRETFEGCSSLKAIAIPSSVTNIGENAFAGCESLSRVNVPSVKDWLKIKFANDAANPLYYGAELYVNGERCVNRIEFDTMCDIPQPTEMERSIRGFYGELPVLSRDDGLFLGWYTAAEGGERVTAECIVDGDCTLHAHWVVASDVEVFSGWPWQDVAIGYVITGSADRPIALTMTAKDNASGKTYVCETVEGVAVEPGSHIVKWNALADDARFKSDEVVFTVRIAAEGVDGVDDNTDAFAEAASTPVAIDTTFSENKPIVSYMVPISYGSIGGFVNRILIDDEPCGEFNGRGVLTWIPQTTGS